MTYSFETHFLKANIFCIFKLEKLFSKEGNALYFLFPKFIRKSRFYKVYFAKLR